MKIALYLGSFNPFHNGHLECIKTALDGYKMDKVIIVPTMQNPWKEEQAIDIDKRLNIIISSLFSSDLDWNTIHYHIDWDLIEEDLIPPYYSYATLHALKNKYCRDEIFVLCGEDTINDIPNWMNGEQIIQDYDFLVIDRPKNSISSSYIRDMVKKGNNIDEYFSPSVVTLIKKYYK